MSTYVNKLMTYHTQMSKLQATPVRAWLRIQKIEGRRPALDLQLGPNFFKPSRGRGSGWR